MAPTKAAATAAATATADAGPTFAPYAPPSGEHITPVTQAIEANATPLAQAFRHIHAVLVLGLFAARFDALVADPVPALLQSLVPLAAAQAVYCAICLPPVAADDAARGIKAALQRRRVGAADSKDARKKPGKKSQQDLSAAARISTAMLSLTLSAIPSIPILFGLAVLLGAPITTHLAHTGLLAAHVALLALPPLFYTRGVDARAWREIVAALVPFDETWGGALGAVLGAWLGAVPIPLDWDRDWQRWPVTVVTGAYIGWALGRYIGEFAVKGWRVRMDVE